MGVLFWFSKPRKLIIRKMIITLRQIGKDIKISVSHRFALILQYKLVSCTRYNKICYKIKLAVHHKLSNLFSSMFVLSVAI